MGLFDKRDKKGRKDDFDSPVEQVDLGAASAPVAAAPSTAAVARPAEPVAPVAAAPVAATPAQAAAAVATPAAAPARAAAAPVRPTMEADDYGIEKAIELMRTLPSENVELVVQVVKFSLESVGIKLPTIIEDAARRQKDIQGKITVRKSEIADLEQEIRIRKEEIDRLEEDHRETTLVRERLELAEQIGQKKKSEPRSDTKSDGDAGGRRSSPTNPPPATLAPLSPTKK
ncbi:MAG TPA: hypothetical protein VM734_10630 [Kofleriaceae bacterium]|jgi:hypothetical protein|nr:hypothetical protein [Kofleriaceae bacterium]